MDQLLTAKELSSFLHVHPKTLYKWIDEGRIPHRKVNGLIRFQKEEIEAFQKKYKPVEIYHPELHPKLDLPLETYDRMFLKGRSALSKKGSGRWTYGIGTVYTRRSKQGKDRYYLDFRDSKGKRKREVVKNALTRAEAVLALQKKVSEIFSRLHSPIRNKNVNFEEFSGLYLENYSKINKKSWMCDFYALEAHRKPHFGKCMLSEIDPLQIEKYRAERLKSGAKKSTTNRELALLKKMFNLAIDWGYTTENPARKVKLFPERDNLKERVLAEDEESRLLEESSEHLKPIILTALNTGMRRSEILSLKWAQVDLGKRVIQVVKTKSGNDRVVPVNDVLYETLKEQKGINNPSEYVFLNPETGEPLKTVRRGFENACRRAGINNMRFHDLRHTFGSRLIQKGVDIVTVQKILGHHSVVITQRYTHTSSDQMKEAVDRLTREKPAKTAENLKDLSHICHTAEKETKDFRTTSLFSVN